MKDFHNFARRTFLQLLGWTWTVPVFIMLRQASRFMGYQPPGPDPTVIALGMPQSLTALPAHI